VAFHPRLAMSPQRENLADFFPYVRFSHIEVVDPGQVRLNGTVGNNQRGPRLPPADITP
jgi:hypothetical protein